MTAPVQITAVAVLGLVSVQRLAELALARRNTRALLAAGGREYGAGHYPLIVLLHAAWLAGLWALCWNRPPLWPWIGLYLGLQPVRVWAIASLGDRWTTRIIVPPERAPVRRGPYRFIAHPNYAVVVGEIAVLPLAFGLWKFAAVFSLLNAAVLIVRIGGERRALRDGAEGADF